MKGKEWNGMERRGKERNGEEEEWRGDDVLEQRKK